MLRQLTVELVIYMQVIADCYCKPDAIVKPKEVEITVLPTFNKKKTGFQKVKQLTSGSMAME